MLKVVRDTSLFLVPYDLVLTRFPLHGSFDLF